MGHSDVLISPMWRDRGDSLRQADSVDQILALYSLIKEGILKLIKKNIFLRKGLLHANVRLGEMNFNN